VIYCVFLQRNYNGKANGLSETLPSAVRDLAQLSRFTVTSCHMTAEVLNPFL